MRTAVRFALLLVLAAAPLGAGCASAAHARTASFEADGVHARHVRIRVAPAHTGAFEELMERCVAVAQARGLPAEHDWLCYREPPGRYWLLQFSPERDGFAVPPAADPLRAFALAVAGPDGPDGPDEAADARVEIEERLASLEYEIEWTVVHRQRTDWSTVDEMSTATHPAARMMVRTVRPGREAAFERALAARTGFLRDNGYPLPVEGFVTVAGAPGTATQVVFPTDWPSFYASSSFGAFVRGLTERERDEYARLKAALMETMASAEYYHGHAVRELSYEAE